MNDKLVPDKGVISFTPEGFAIITPKESNDMWTVVDGLIADYTRVHPEEVKEIIETAKEHRANLRNTTAASEGGSLRHALVLPVGLNFLLKKSFPEIFREKKVLREFMKRYPGFRIPEKL